MNPIRDDAILGGLLPGPASIHLPCFFLDIDGTLIDFSDRPEDVRITPAVQSLVCQLRLATDGAVALISGRSLADIDRLFAPLKLPAAGQHGVERRDGGGRLHLRDKDGACLSGAAEKLKLLLARHPGLLLEDKGASLALHYRRVPELAAVANETVRHLADGLGGKFEILLGKMVVEIKPKGKNKGAAIADFMEEEPFIGRVPVFIGDDITDDHGFSVVNSRGGCSIKVGAGSSTARWQVPDVHAVHAWLSGFLQ